MRYAVGKPGANVRTYVTCSADQLAGAMRSGEVSLATDLAGARAFTADGKALTDLIVAVETDAQALTRMLGVIDAECEQRSMAFLTAGGAKKYEYAAKAKEAYDYGTLSTVTLAGLLTPQNLASTQARFPWATAEVADSGDTLAVVMSRFAAGISASNLTQRLAARSQKLKRALRAAQPSARAAIFNARSWPT